MYGNSIGLLDSAQQSAAVADGGRRDEKLKLGLRRVEPAVRRELGDCHAAEIVHEELLRVVCVAVLVDPGRLAALLTLKRLPMSLVGLIFMPSDVCTSRTLMGAYPVYGNMKRGGAPGALCSRP